MPRVAKLPRDVALGAKVAVVGALGSPGRGAGLALHAPAGPGSTLRMLAFDDALALEADRSRAFDDPFSSVTPLSGGAWCDGRPVIYVFGGAPLACHAPDGDDWLESAARALTSPWLESALAQRPKPAGSDYGKGYPRCGVFLGGGWWVGANFARTARSPHVESLFRYTLQDPSVRTLITMGSNDPDENAARYRRLPRVLTRVAAWGEQRIVFAGCSVSKSGGFDFKLGHYDSAADALHGVPTERHTERITLAHDGRGRFLVFEQGTLFRYGTSLTDPEVATAREAPFLQSFRLVAGNVEGHTLWLDTRAKKICVVSPDELAGDLVPSLAALEG